MLRSLLIAVDLSPISDRVVGRAARLPLGEASHLTLLHVIPRSMAPPDRRRAERDARRVLEEEARSLAVTLPRRSVVERIVRVGAPAAEIAQCAESMKAEMIVMGRGNGQAFREVFLGSTAERVFRRTRLPVLAVRLRPRSRYGRPAIALDVDRGAPEIVSLLLRVIPPPRPSMLLIHAYTVAYASQVYPSLSEGEFEERSEEHRRRALGAIEEVLTTALERANVPPGDAPSWKMHVRYGSPRSVIEKVVTKADTDLLVLGTRGYSGLAYAFLGTVAGDVLRKVACDVLVVPPGSRKRRRSSAGAGR
jgi:nucleotide-binding universal stress UspA family protein